MSLLPNCLFTTIARADPSYAVSDPPYLKISGSATDDTYFGKLFKSSHENSFSHFICALIHVSNTLWTICLLIKCWLRGEHILPSLCSVFPIFQIRKCGAYQWNNTMPEMKIQVPFKVVNLKCVFVNPVTSVEESLTYG